MDAAVAKRVVQLCRGAESGDGELRIESSRTLAGGCISRAAVCRLSDSRQVVVKTNSASAAAMFEQEAAGLERIAATGTIAVPRVIGRGTSEDGRCALLVIEYINGGSPRSDFYESFGRELAALHRAAGPTQFGFAEDNFLGSALQPNGWTDNWTEFFRERRLRHQLGWAQQQGLATSQMIRGVERLCESLDDLLATDETPSLIHGDLWSGNYLADSAGRPVIIDPAAYYAHREAELGMVDWMGSCPAAFWEAYDEAFPLQAGWHERVAVYRLYHELNHLNLFGSGYASSVMSTLRSLSVA